MIFSHADTNKPKDTVLLENDQCSSQFSRVSTIHPVPGHPHQNRACGIMKITTTNNKLEGYFGQIKNNLHKNKKQQKISYFKSRQATITKRLIEITETNISFRFLSISTVSWYSNLTLFQVFFSKVG